MGAVMFVAKVQIPIYFQSHVHKKKLLQTKDIWTAKKIKAVNDICARTILPYSHRARNEVEQFLSRSQCFDKYLFYRRTAFPPIYLFSQNGSSLIGRVRVRMCSFEPACSCSTHILNISSKLYMFWTSCRLTQAFHHISFYPNFFLKISTRNRFRPIDINRMQ